MKRRGNRLTADEGKCFVRRESGENFGSVIFLGYSYYIGGARLNAPHKDVPEDFDEVTAPEPEDDNATE